MTCLIRSLLTRNDNLGSWRNARVPAQLPVTWGSRTFRAGSSGFSAATQQPACALRHRWPAVRWRIPSGRAADAYVAVVVSGMAAFPARAQRVRGAAILLADSCRPTGLAAAISLSSATRGLDSARVCPDDRDDARYVRSRATRSARARRSAAGCPGTRADHAARTLPGGRVLSLQRVAVVTIQPRNFMDLREGSSSCRRESSVGVALALDRRVTSEVAAPRQKKRYSSHERHATPDRMNLAPQVAEKIGLCRLEGKH